MTNSRSLLCSLLLLGAAPLFAEEPAWSVLAGGARSQIGWGSTSEQVDSLDLVLRQDRPRQNTRGRGRWLNRKSVYVEIPFSWFSRPDEAPLIGLTMNMAWKFIHSPVVRPYLLIGGGGAFTTVEIPGTSARLKGVYQFGGGVELPRLFNHHGLFLELRYHHMSNGGIRQPNDSVNSLKFLVGSRWR